MKALIIYDTAWNNTKTIAERIADGIKEKAEVVFSRAGDYTGDSWESYDLLVVGSPTQGGRALQPVASLLNRIPANALSGKKVAAFDTRMVYEKQGLFLKLVMKVVQFAAPRIARQLRAKGGKLAAEPEGFFVLGKEGPLKDGEEERAREWGRVLVNKQ